MVGFNNNWPALMLFPAYRALSTALEFVPGPWRGPEPLAIGPETSGVIHGASAGEIKAARALRHSLSQEEPEQHWLISTGTSSGLANGADLRLPRDLPRRTARLFEATRMKSLLLIEAEFWPNLLAEAAIRGVSVGVAGARVSAVSHSRMSRLPGTVSHLLSGVKAFAAASNEDAERLCSLGAPANRVAVCGWLKWPESLPATSLEALLVGLEAGPTGDRPLLVLGSVYPGEATALSTLLRDGPLAAGQAHWLLVARHARHGASLRREAASLCAPGTFSVDTRFGVLRSWYAHADATYVGGGLHGRGCHDLLEPVAAGQQPLCHTRAGDPGCVAATLAERELALCLDDLGQRKLPEATSARFRVADGAYDELKADADGRRRTIDFLRNHGVLL